MTWYSWDDHHFWSNTSQYFISPRDKRKVVEPKIKLYYNHLSVSIVKTRRKKRIFPAFLLEILLQIIVGSASQPPLRPPPVPPKILFFINFWLDSGIPTEVLNLALQIVLRLQTKEHLPVLRTFLNE